MLLISEKLSTDSRRMLQNGVPRFGDFCRCTPCRQRRGKGFAAFARARPDRDALRAGSAEAKLRRSSNVLYAFDALRAGSAEAKEAGIDDDGHPVLRDALRAGSAEAKRHALSGVVKLPGRCTPCRQRRGKAVCTTGGIRSKPGCTPCRQRRGKDLAQGLRDLVDDALRAGSAEAKQE